MKLRNLFLTSRSLFLFAGVYHLGVRHATADIDRRRRRGRRLWIGAILILVGACGDEQIVVERDTTPPAKVTDLVFQPVSATTVLLLWTAPGDDGTTGRAAQYDIRQAASRLAGDEWNQAQVVAASLTPQAAGEVESLTVTDLVAGFQSYFALRSADEVPNWSEWSDPETGPLDLPPETMISSSPPDSGSTWNVVPLYWRGSDADGVVASFDFILVDHPAIVDSIVTASPDAPNRLVIRVPEPDDPRWRNTSATDSIFVTLADILRDDPRGDIGEGLFDRWHTFFVRSVDDLGLPDFTPDYVSFRSFTKAPVLYLEAPAATESLVTLPPSFTLRWDGEDPIGNGTFHEPTSARWVLLEANLDQQGNPIGFPDALFDLPESAWGEWAAWSAPDSSGRKAVFTDVLPAGVSEQGFVFAVQGRDDGGAITPQFDSTTPGANNMTPILVRRGP